MLLIALSSSGQLFNQLYRVNTTQNLLTLGTLKAPKAVAKLQSELWFACAIENEHGG